MHPSKVITDPRVNDTYYDPDLDKLYQYVKFGDYPPEWIDTTPYKEDDFIVVSDQKTLDQLIRKNEKPND